MQAASFFVPPDQKMVANAHAIVIASALTSHTELRDGRIETVTTMSLEDVLKGSLPDSFDVYEPGGTFEDRSTVIPGVPRFEDGQTYLLFLVNTDRRWHVLDLVLGKFRFETDVLGRKVLVRDAGEIAGWDPDGTPHREKNREAGPFLAFIRSASVGGPRRQNYFIPAEPLIGFLAPPPGRRSLNPITNATFTATSYTYTISGSLGGRWNVFPSPVNFFSVGTEPGAPGGGATAITAAFAAWNGDPGSNVNYVYAGADTSGAHTTGVGGSDGENTIIFERDLSAYGAGPFTCTSNSYSGTLGLGGITNASGTHTGPNGETFETTHEGDVEMNKGIANCTLLFNNGDFNSAVTHEVGHTLGFRHSDQTRADNSSVACTTDLTLECSNTAIMKSFVSTGLNATLQAWDQHAVDAVYPGSSGVTGSVPATVTGVLATAVSPTQVNVTWTASSGATSYQILRRGPSDPTFVVIGTSTTTSFSDTTAAANTSYLYRVRALNSVGSSPDSAGDIATTVIFTDDPIVPGVTVIKSVHITQLRTAVNAVRALAGMAPATFSTPPGPIIRTTDITELRAALDPALTALGLSAGGWTDPTLTAGTPIKAVHIQEIRNRVK